eukprot:4582-Heterococcus_DN1.PRE.3
MLLVRNVARALSLLHVAPGSPALLLTALPITITVVHYEQAYVLSKKIEGHGDEVNPVRPIPPLMDEDFIYKVHRIPETVYMQLTGTSESALQSAIRASETKYFPYFERGAGGSGSLIQDLRNQTYYSFATYAQWRVFMDGGIKTSKQAAEFTSAVGREALATVLSDVPLKRYNARSEGLTEALSGCTKLLQRLQAVGYITGTTADLPEH